MPVRVAHLSSVHPPSDTRIYLKQCRSLARAGYEVTLIARQETGFCPSDIRFIPVPVPRSRLERMTRTLTSVYRAACEVDADIYQFHDPELIPVGLLLKRRGKAVVYDVHEDYGHAILDKEWLARPLRARIAKLTDWLEQKAAHYWDKTVCATHAIARKFPPDRRVLVQNFPLREEFSDFSKVAYNNRPKQVAYVGAISKLRGIVEMTNALALSQNPVRLQLLGHFCPQGLQEKMETSRGWTHVDFRGPRSRREVGEILAQCRAGLVLFQPVGNHLESQPNKLFEYLAAGIPVIASDFPLWRQLVEQNQVGLLVDPRNPAAIAKAIDWVLDNPGEAQAMGERGRQWVWETCNWEKQAEALLLAYEDISRTMLKRGQGSVVLTH